MERDPVDPRIEYEFISEPCPSEANGRFLGFEWGFYSRWDRWDFMLAYDPNVCIWSLDLRGRQPCEAPPGVFYREEAYGDGWSAGYMTTEEKKKVIRRCIAEFEAEQRRRNLSGPDSPHEPTSD